MLTLFKFFKIEFTQLLLQFRIEQLFQDGHQGDHLLYQNGMILAILYLHVTLHLALMPLIYITLVNVYIDLVVFTRIAGTS